MGLTDTRVYAVVKQTGCPTSAGQHGQARTVQPGDSRDGPPWNQWPTSKVFTAPAELQPQAALIRQLTLRLPKEF